MNAENIQKPVLRFIGSFKSSLDITYRKHLLSVGIAMRF
jgi:hypothetical protein